MNQESVTYIPTIYLPTQAECGLATPDNNFFERFVKHNIENGRAKLCDSPEQADFIILFQEWSFKLPAYVAKLTADILVKNFATKLYVVNYDSTVGEGFLPGCYVSLRQSNHNPKRFLPCAYPKSYNEFITSSSYAEDAPQYLYSFRGTLHSHPVRKVMFDALKGNDNGLMVDNTKAFHTHTNEEKQIYLNELVNSVFVLCPRGTSPNSYRLFEAMSLGRCPVIISDEWVETPGPNWLECSIRIQESDASSIFEVLKDRRNEGISKGKRARQEWLKHFTEEKTYQAYLNQIISLYRSEKTATKPFTELKKHWRSHSFLFNNNWTLRQKIMRRLKR